MKIKTILQLNGKTATGINVPNAVVEALGSGKRPAVRVTIRGFMYRTTIAPMDGVFMIPVSAEIRKSAGIVAGDELEVDIVLDTAPREVAVPADLAAALSAQPGAMAKFEASAYSIRKEYARQVDDAKTAETRTRRIASIVAKLTS